MSYKGTYSDRQEYLIMVVAKRRKEIREKALKYLGGICFFCGYYRYHAVLDFHHIDKKTNKFGLSQNGITRSWESTKKELDKCILICSNCHRELHVGLLQPSAEMLNGKIRLIRGNPEKSQRVIPS